MMPDDEFVKYLTDNKILELIEGEYIKHCAVDFIMPHNKREGSEHDNPEVEYKFYAITNWRFIVLSGDGSGTKSYLLSQIRGVEFHRMGCWCKLCKSEPQSIAIGLMMVHVNFTSLHSSAKEDQDVMEDYLCFKGRPHLRQFFMTALTDELLSVEAEMNEEDK